MKHVPLVKGGAPAPAPRAAPVKRSGVLEAAAPVLPGMVFNVSGSGPYLLQCRVGTRVVCLTVPDESFPNVYWEQLVERVIANVNG